MGDITAFDENLVRVANSSHFSSPQECLEVFKVSVSLMIYGIKTPYPLNHPAWMIWEYCCGRQAWANSWWDSYPPSWTIRTCSDSSFWPLSFSVLEISTRESPPLPIHPPPLPREEHSSMACLCNIARISSFKSAFSSSEKNLPCCAFEWYLETLHCVQHPLHGLGLILFPIIMRYGILPASGYFTNVEGTSYFSNVEGKDLFTTGVYIWTMGRFEYAYTTWCAEHSSSWLASTTELSSSWDSFCLFKALASATGPSGFLFLFSGVEPSQAMVAVHAAPTMPVLVVSVASSIILFGDLPSRELSKAFQHHHMVLHLLLEPTAKEGTTSANLWPGTEDFGSVPSTCTVM